MSQVDRRRVDERVPVNSEPFFFSSAVIGPADAGNNIVLKSFPLAAGRYLVTHAGVEIITAFDGSASIAVGSGTMATDALGTVTVVDAAMYAVTADVTEATAGYYPGAASSLVTAMAAGTSTIIKGVDSTVPVIYMTLGGSPTVGACRVHVQLVRLPTVSPV